MVSQHLKNNWFCNFNFLPQILLGGCRQSEARPDYTLNSKDQFAVLKVVREQELCGSAAISWSGTIISYQICQDPKWLETVGFINQFYVLYENRRWWIFMGMFQGKPLD